MTYATVRDVPASWDRYIAPADALTKGLPSGLVLHAAGPTDEGFRIIEIWVSREDFERSQTSGVAGLGVSAVCPTTLREFEAVVTIHGNSSP